LENITFLEGFQNFHFASKFDVLLFFFEFIMRPAVVCQHIAMDSEINSTERGQIKIVANSKILIFLFINQF
jgi:hypothetical protein